MAEFYTIFDHDHWVDISAGGLLIVWRYHPPSSHVLLGTWHDLIDIFIIKIYIIIIKIKVLLHQS